MQRGILLIDDEDLVTKSIEKLLKREGYEVFTCSSGEAAIQKMQDQEVDLIVCDIRMPKMNGVETIKAIRELNNSKKRKNPKEILITGYSEDEVNKQALDLKVDEYIYKPFDIRDFLNAVKKTMGD